MEALCCSGLSIVRGKNIMLASYLLKQKGGYVHERPVSMCSFVGFSWCRAQNDTSTLLLCHMGFEWMFTYHLSPLLAANVVSSVV